MRGVERFHRSSHSTPTIPTGIDRTRLSERGQAILRLIVIPTSNGYSIPEVARELGTTMRWVLDRVDGHVSGVTGGSAPRPFSPGFAVVAHVVPVLDPPHSKE
jgi:hypothetical protein